MADLHMSLNDISSAISYLNQAKKLFPYDDLINQKLESFQFAKGIIMLKNDLISIENLIEILEDENKKNHFDESDEKGNLFVTGLNINDNNNDSKNNDKNVKGLMGLTVNSVYYLYFK